MRTPISVDSMNNDPLLLPARTPARIFSTRGVADPIPFEMSGPLAILPATFNLNREGLSSSSLMPGRLVNPAIWWRQISPSVLRSYCARLSALLYPSMASYFEFK